jgi:type II secretory pathway pseudopilin PulG
MWRESGFSLLELIAVLGLTAVLFGIALFGHGAARSRISVAKAVQQVSMDLSLARIRAITRSRDQRLLFAAGAESYQQQERSETGYENAGPAQALPAGVRIANCSAPNDAIGFHARGGASSFGTITLRGATGETRSIIVSITGRARTE